FSYASHLLLHRREYRNSMSDVVDDGAGQIRWQMLLPDPRRGLMAGGEVGHDRLGVEVEFDIIAVVVEQIDRQPLLVSRPGAGLGLQRQKRRIELMGTGEPGRPIDEREAVTGADAPGAWVGAHGPLDRLLHVRRQRRGRVP